MIGSSPHVGPQGTFVAVSVEVWMTGPSAAAGPTSASAAETLATEMMRSLVMVLPPFGCIASRLLADPVDAGWKGKPELPGVGRGERDPSRERNRPRHRVSRWVDPAQLVGQCPDRAPPGGDCVWGAGERDAPDDRLRDGVDVEERSSQPRPAA